MPAGKTVLGAGVAGAVDGSVGMTITEEPGAVVAPLARAPAVGVVPAAPKGAFISIIGMGVYCGTPGVGMVADGGAGGVGGAGGALWARSDGIISAAQPKMASDVLAQRRNEWVLIRLPLPCPLWRSSAGALYI